MKKSITMLFEEDLINEAQRRSEELGISRSGYINLALSTYMKQEKLVEEMPKLYATMGELNKALKQAQLGELSIDIKETQ